MSRTIAAPRVWYVYEITGNQEALRARYETKREAEAYAGESRASRPNGFLIVRPSGEEICGLMAGQPVQDQEKQP